MEFIVDLLLCMEAALAYWLLLRSGALKSEPSMYVSALLIALAFALRALCLSYETLDYKDFLCHWVDFYRQNGGFAALSMSNGNYNIPYLYFLALFSYLPVDDLYLIKLLSIFFDVILAWSVMGLVKHLGAAPLSRLASFIICLFLPTVILNGALWGQCDSIYVALALLGLYLALEDRPALSVLAMSLSFGFKLQAVFILPVMAVLWFMGKYKFRHFFLFPLFYVLLVLPAVLLGRPFMDTIMLYFNQTGSIGSGLNYNSPSIFAIFWNVQDEATASKLAILAAFLLMGLVLLLCYINRRRLSSRSVILAALLFAVGIPLLLPHMHDRYFFGADILALAAAFGFAPLVAAPALCQFASLLGYHAYLKMRYFLPMKYGSYALILVLLIGLACIAYEFFNASKKDGHT